VSCYTDFLFIWFVLGLLHCFWKIKCTDKVIDDFDFSFLVYCAVSSFAGSLRNINLVDKLRKTVASSSDKSVYFFAAAMKLLTLCFFCSCCFKSLRSISAIDFRLSCSSSYSRDSFTNLSSESFPVTLSSYKCLIIRSSSAIRFSLFANVSFFV